MTPDEKLAAILAAVQTDPGNRGLARDPEDNLFTATSGDFERASQSFASHSQPIVAIVTGFIIPSVEPPMFETDGPLGTTFLGRAFAALNISTLLLTDQGCEPALRSGTQSLPIIENEPVKDAFSGNWIKPACQSIGSPTHIIALERVGPATNRRCHTMRGRDVTDLMLPAHHLFQRDDGKPLGWTTIGIGDGGNEIGMGKIPHETIVKNIPNGDLIHCRVPTDHLIVAGVSNWGAYALAAGIFALKGITPPDDLFDPDREREILEVMVKAGPLVDGVTGKQEATVDGLTWEEYVKPLVRIRDILAS